MAPGTATITVTTADGGHRATVAVTVAAATAPPVAVTGVTIAGEATRNLTVGQTLPLAATVAPANATNPAVTVLYRMEGEPDVEFEPTFNDVPAGRWYSEAVIWANQNGIVTGIGGSRFAPSGNITREQLATMLYRYAGYKGYDRDVPDTASLDEFSDYALTSSWAEDAMRWAVYHELVRGDRGALMPDGTATRAQYATILQRLIDRFEFER